MSKERSNINYNAKDIEQYFAGKLLPAQMHAMERAALDDPFLADAMEGYGIMQDKEYKTHLADLHLRLEERSSMAKIVPMQQSATRKWWKIAAAVFIICSGATLTWILTKDKKDTEAEPHVVQTIPTTKDTGNDQSTVSATVIVTPEKEKATAPTVLKPTTGKTVQGNKDLIAQNDQAVNYNGNPVYKQDNSKPLRIARTEAKIVNNDSLKSQALSTPPTPPLTNNSMATFEKDNNGDLAKRDNDDAYRKKLEQNAAASAKTLPLNRSFNAQVLAPDNTPLPFSNISIRSANFGTYADVKGNFRLVSSDSILIVEVRSVGYLPQVFALRSNQPQNKIVLAEDEIAYKEKAVVQNRIVGAGISRRVSLIKDSVVNVEPADGWDNYNTYIANNIELPDDVLKNDVHGEIGISFDVRSNGTITNIKIDPSLCNSCEEITKRLIEQGPQWKIKKGKKASARVKVQF